MEAEITGLSELVARLGELGTTVQTRATFNALREGAGVVLEAIQAVAPVQEMRTASSNSLSPGQLKEGFIAEVSRVEGTPTATVKPTAEVERVALWVEYGHRSVKGGYLKIVANGKTRGPGKAGKDVQAHPFIRPAFEESAAGAVAAMEKVLVERITKGGV